MRSRSNMRVAAMRVTDGKICCALAVLLALASACDSSKTIHDGPMQLPD
jgi:hypothetical protein